MSSRIQIIKGDERLEIIVKAFYDDTKQKILLAWIVLFSLCGLAILSQFFQDYDAGTKVFFGIYVAFWFFFEFKVIYAYRWRKYGEEKIIVENSQFSLIKTIGSRGVTQRFNIDEIKKIDFYKDANGGFVKSMNTSYWNINKYHLVLTLDKSIIPFAIDIETKEAKRILNELRSFK
ncbi:MAG: hypothetical protein COA97_03610 [Flavobacteriales bacterium]|nr:MAG: hypothetical protein COA97_03610 [Flavobacteriales bacterium]